MSIKISETDIVSSEWEVYFPTYISVSIRDTDTNLITKYVLNNVKDKIQKLF